MDKKYDSWFIVKKGFNINNIEYDESIFSLGNGYMGCRGFDEEDETEEYKLCTYIAGIFDYFTTGITDMVNTPNFWRTDIYINGERFSKKNGKFIEYEKKLNMRDGILIRNVIWENSKGSRTKIETKRFLSFDNRHTAVMQIKVTPLNYSGNIEIETGIDADVKNNIIEDDQMKNDKNLYTFLNAGEKRIDKDGVMLINLKTKKSGFSICEGFGINIEPKGNFLSKHIISEKYIGTRISIDVKENKEFVFNKVISLWTSRDCEEDLLEQNVTKDLKYSLLIGFDRLYELSLNVWNNRWNICDVVIRGDEKSQRAIRYNMFQLIQTVSPDDSRISIGARGIMHGRYKGCYFWDTEIFMLPFYEYTYPEAAKNLLMYRYNTLQGALMNAKNQNLEGARYAWMSSIDGLEQCTTWDIGFSEVHITADIAYAIDRYYKVTKDIDFIINFGLEILIETSRYWRSRFTYDESTGRYNMLFVKGPNEYGGITINNTFTTVMAIHNLKSAIKFIELVKEKYIDFYNNLKNKINFKEDEIKEWIDIINKAVILYDSEKKLYIEDENFFKTEPLNLMEVKEGNKPLYRKICFDRLQRYRVLKQADVILLMLLLPDNFTFEEKMAAWNCYEPITTHDSSLSFGTHAEAAAKLGLVDKAYEYFEKSVNVDIDNILDNTDKEGIHFASLGASYQALIHGFGGIEIKDGFILINPSLPKVWEELSFKILYRDNLLSFKIDREKVKVNLIEDSGDKVIIKHKDVTIKLLKKGDELIFNYLK